MNKLTASATLCASFLCLNLANAGGDIVIPNGKGIIPLNTPAVMKLENFNEKAAYDVICKVSATNGNNAPVIFRLDAYNINLGFSSRILFDGNALATSQAKISDNNEHTLAIMGVNTGPNNGMVNASIVITKLMGNDVNPFYYDCSANYEVGAN